MWQTESVNVSHHPYTACTMPRRDQPIPELPPSGTALPDHERRERASTLEWMHEAAEPQRKKRVDPLPDDMVGWNRRAFGNVFDDMDG